MGELTDGERADAEERHAAGSRIDIKHGRRDHVDSIRVESDQARSAISTSPASTHRITPRITSRITPRTVIALLCIVVGSCILIYPIVTQLQSASHETHLANTYLDDAARLQAQEKSRLIANAEDYNSRVYNGLTPQANLNDESFHADSDYMNQLSVRGVIATINIPKISVSLPIYHGTDEATLSAGAGHLYGTSLPIGGTDTNSVIAAHRGLPNALMFTRLNELSEGDTFAIEVLGEKHWYRVDATWVVAPDDTSHFAIVNGKDYVTLLTCTPYGINTQRLLVRGERISAPAAAQPDTGFYPAGTYALVCTGILTIIGCTAVWLRRRTANEPTPHHARR